MTDAARFAAYYAPETDDPLWEAGTAWLGRDPETGAPLPRPQELDIPDLTDEPAAYGLHATLKPPMRLAAGTPYQEFVAAVSGLAGSLSAFILPPLAVADFDGFLALREQAPCAELQQLADRTVAELDRFREPPNAAEVARRRRHGLTQTEDAMLERWGYPYVFSLWRFHITLSRRLNAEEMAKARPLAEAHFAAALRQPREVRSLALFTQRAAGQPFLIAERFPLGR